MYSYFNPNPHSKRVGDCVVRALSKATDKSWEDTYICPLLTFSHLQYGEIGYDAEMENCLDLLSVADKLIVASDLSKGVCKEIDFANLVGMEVQYLEEDTD